MIVDPNEFLFPAVAVPHTRFTAKHVFMMATINGAIKSGKTSLRILEVGSWLGASTLLWSESILRFGNEAIARNSSILAVDSWNPILSSEDLAFENYRTFVNAAKNDVAYNIFAHNATLGAKRFGVKIDWIRGRSEDVIQDLDTASFDIAYLDAGHYYDDVLTDIALTKDLVKVGGTICGDDLNLLMDQVDLEAARAGRNRDVIQDPKTGCCYHPGVTLAVGESFPAVGSCAGFWSVRKASDDVYLPSDLAFDGIFIPSFLSDEDARFFSDYLSAPREQPEG